MHMGLSVMDSAPLYYLSHSNTGADGVNRLSIHEHNALYGIYIQHHAEERCW